VQPRQLALEVIKETNGYWKDLVMGRTANDLKMAF
jgi:hypothetical protein